MEKRRDDAAAALALRDFFFAADREELRAAYGRLAAASPERAPEVGDWAGEEFAFNRLFVGPGPLAAPPYASVYLDPEPTLMGEATLLARQVYQAAGLVSPWKNSVPDDHLSLELDAALAMAAGLRRGWDVGLASLRAFFLTEHMGAWVPRFAGAVREAAGDAPALAFAARRLEDWLSAETRAAQDALIQ